MLKKEESWIDVYFKPCGEARLAHQVLRGFLDKVNRRFYNAYSNNKSLY